jgi:hypothetical protein
LGLLVLIYCLAAIVRSMFLGVWVAEGEVIVSTWFRRRRFVVGEVEVVELEIYMGMGGFAVGWIPFAGNVRMIGVRLVSGRLVSLPSTIGRFRRVLRVARKMQIAVGLSERHM